MLSILFNHFRRINHMRVAPKDNISTPINHLMVKLYLFICRFQTIFHAHLWHDNRNVSLFFSTLNLYFHPFFIKIRQMIRNLFFGQIWLQAIETIGIRKYCHLDAINILDKQRRLITHRIFINTNRVNAHLFKCIGCCKSSL